MSVQERVKFSAYHLLVYPEGRDDGYIGHGHLCRMEEVVIQPLHLFQAVWGNLQQEVSLLQGGRDGYSIYLAHENDILHLKCDLHRTLFTSMLQLFHWFCTPFLNHKQLLCVSFVLQ